ncbi:hypothetical protein [Arthrobacter sp. lap29]|uniref:hypothetical protein n=1 Tax=Arthrobacter sp. lap29 TaxID=3056122 RepID=UPI0028F70A6B|nr:hypothetical protein [Arthrobacter sp. lap29]
MGAVFEPIRIGVTTETQAVRSTLEERHHWMKLAESSQIILITDLERCIETAADVLGDVRAKVFSLLDAGKMVCLFSRAPRISFRAVPGSSILEDAALVTLPLLAESEFDLEPGVRPEPGWSWPSVTFGAPLDTSTFKSALEDIGQGLVAALDHALFEVNPKGTDGLEYLAAREIEGLRGAGLVKFDDNGKPQLVLSRSTNLLREALATHISETVTPASILPEVTLGLWYTERKIRSALRKAAIDKYGSKWYASTLGGLTQEVLRRAQLDTSVAAKSIADLRDPLEWLTLSELMEIVRSSKFDNLGVEPAIWRKLQEQLVPIRNRLAHVRMLKSDDAEVVRMWATLIRTRFDA